MIKTRVFGFGVNSPWPAGKRKEGAQNRMKLSSSQKNWCFSEFAISFKLVGQIFERDTTIPFKEDFIDAT
jgi:hypothetical protein